MEALNDFNFHSLSRTYEKEIEEVYSNWKKAVMTNDVRFLENLYTDDFTSTSSSGIIKNKSEVLTRLRFKDVQYLFWEDKNVLIDIKGKSAIVESRQTLNIQVYNLPIKMNRDIRLTFVKLLGGWLLENTHETSV